MADFRRKRSHLKLPIWTSAVLGTLNLTLMLVLIILLAQQQAWLALVLGSIALGISLFGISFYSVLTIKEIQLNRRQSNFVDSVTHELKTPIAALRLYLDTLLMRELNETDRREFYETMETELERLDRLINQLLEVGRLDAIGSQTEPERVNLSDLLTDCAEVACRHHKHELAEVFAFDLAPLHLDARRMLLEMIFGNLMDNAVKYGGDPPKVHVSAMVRGRDRIVIRVHDHGAGVPEDQRHQVFQLFFRGSDELQRTRKGTGLGLYIVRTLVGIMKGRVTISDGPDGAGSVFEVTLPGRLLARPTDKPTDSASVHDTAKGSVETGEKARV
ncbi:MAG TPA: HAMP domain-containing histidine kinase [Planctomycetes bacterium]|nr:HAMP domain-containing histidine kinase [Fuerstiella sp.]HIK95749.1 HAMP domain-containing histidine kinase [Planctomycetota bacterium]